MRFQHVQGPAFDPQYQVKEARLALTYDLSILKVEAGESGVERYLQQLSELEAILGYLRP